jgi:23S rRNA (guanosine2251-2'-O)-methyltransferase
VSSELPFRATRAGESYDPVIRLPVSVVLDSVRSLYNVGAFFRTLDAVAGDTLYLAGITATPPDARIAKTALGAETTVAWRKTADVPALVATLREGGTTIAAVETTSVSVDLFDWQPAFPVCLVFGHEVDGLPAAVLEACDVHVRIPMLGRKHSLNVATAGGVVLYELLRKYRRPDYGI